MQILFLHLNSFANCPSTFICNGNNCTTISDSLCEIPKPQSADFTKKDSNTDSKNFYTNTQTIKAENNKVPNSNLTTSFGACAENGSCYGDTSSINGRPKTVEVQGYYLSNGTYVRGYYRSK